MLRVLVAPLNIFNDFTVWALFELYVLLEQYFKRHPMTKFNKTPSAKYILL